MSTFLENFREEASCGIEIPGLQLSLDEYLPLNLEDETFKNVALRVLQNKNETEFIVKLEIDSFFEENLETAKKKFKDFATTIFVGITFCLKCTFRDLKCCVDQIDTGNGRVAHLRPVIEISAQSRSFSPFKFSEKAKHEGLFEFLKMNLSDDYLNRILLQYHNAMTHPDPTTQYILLYNILLQVTAKRTKKDQENVHIEEDQKNVDKAIRDICGVSQNIKHTKSPRGKREIIYTCLRNELCHYRKEREYESLSRKEDVTFEKILKDIKEISPGLNWIAENIIKRAVRDGGYFFSLEVAE